MTLTVEVYEHRFNRYYRNLLKAINPEITKEKYESKYYIAGKEAAGALAFDFIHSFSRGDIYGWGDIIEIGAYFEELARRYGLIREFRENGII